MTPAQFFGVRFERVAPLRLRLSFPSAGSRLCACTKHLSGILIGASLLLRIPETHWFPHSSNQIRDGSSSSWLRARARGRARREGALRRPANVRRGGGSPIKAYGCRAWSKRPSRASQSWPRSQIFGSLSGLMMLALPFVPDGTGSGWTAGSPTSAPFKFERESAPCQRRAPC